MKSYSLGAISLPMQESQKDFEHVPGQLLSKRKCLPVQSSPAESWCCVLPCDSQTVTRLPSALAPSQGKASVSHGARLPRGDVPKSVRKAKITWAKLPLKIA